MADQHDPIPHVTIDALKALGGWQPLRTGVQKLVLGLGEGGQETALLWYAAGASVPRHRHEGRETIVVLEGEQTDEQGTYGAGALRINDAGTDHSVRSAPGCLVLIHWEQPVRFL